MRVFVYEFLCATEGAASSLRAEGEAMLGAVVRDFAALPGIDVVTFPRVERSGEEDTFRAMARAADFTQVIAPEFDDLLRTRCRWVEEAGGRLLGPTSEAVALTGDKQELARHLRRAGVPTPECRPCSSLDRPTAVGYPAVWKPRYGAGSQATFLVRNEAELRAARQQAAAEGWTGAMMLQRFVPGRAASVAFLIGARQRLTLLPAEQCLSTDGRFHYLGGRIPLEPDMAERTQHLADRAVAAVPGLRGYVGVDVVLGDSGDVVIEINPRLTTSYIGLRRLAAGNLAGAMLRVVEGREDVELTWRSGRVSFAAAGEEGGKLASAAPEW
jgi:predicted ATP-grasp superfamily ATP-dependent carboligase